MTVERFFFCGRSLSLGSGLQRPWGDDPALNGKGGWHSPPSCGFPWASSPTESGWDRGSGQRVVRCGRWKSELSADSCPQPWADRRGSLGVGGWGAVPAMVRRSDEAVCVCVHWRAVGGLAPALGPGVFWGTAVQLMAGIWALTCLPHPELLFMTNCFVL